MPGDYYNIPATGLWANFFKYALYITILIIFILILIWQFSPETFAGISESISAWGGGIGDKIGGALGDVWDVLIKFLSETFGAITSLLTGFIDYLVSELGNIFPW